VHEFRWENLGQFQGIDPRGGAEFDENSPNLTEDVSFEFGTTLVRIEGPEEYTVRNRIKDRREVVNDILMVQQGGCGACLAKANNGNSD